MWTESAISKACTLYSITVVATRGVEESILMWTESATE